MRPARRPVRNNACDAETRGVPIRTIAQIEKRLREIAAELERLRKGELFKLMQSVEEARSNRRDLLRELADRLAWEIQEARDELEHATNTVTQ